MFPVEFDPGDLNATAYAAKRADGKVILAIINKDAMRSLTSSIAGYRLVIYRSLKAASLTSTEVSWNDRNTNSVGHIPTRMERSLIEGGGQPAFFEALQIPIPSSSAVLFELTA